jgi:hypothetical protein
VDEGNWPGGVIFQCTNWRGLGFRIPAFTIWINYKGLAESMYFNTLSKLASLQTLWPEGCPRGFRAYGLEDVQLGLGFMAILYSIGPECGCYDQHKGMSLFFHAQDGFQSCFLRMQKINICPCPEYLYLAPFVGMLTSIIFSQNWRIHSSVQCNWWGCGAQIWMYWMSCWWMEVWCGLRW